LAALLSSTGVLAPLPCNVAGNPIPSSLGSNLIVNGDFEHGTEGWAFYILGENGFYRIATEDPQPSYRKMWTGDQSLELYATNEGLSYWCSTCGAGAKQTVDTTTWNMKYSFAVHGAASPRGMGWGFLPTVASKLVFHTSAGDYTLVYYYIYYVTRIDFTKPYYGHILLLNTFNPDQQMWHYYEQDVKADFEACFGPITNQLTLNSVDVELELLQPVFPYNAPHVFWDAVSLQNRPVQDECIWP